MIPDAASNGLQNPDDVFANSDTSHVVRATILLPVECVVDCSVIGRRWRIMQYKNGSFSASRRRLLRLLGLGAAGMAVGTLAGPGRLFATQFVGEATQLKLPKMVYDPELQMMVDPATRAPIYTDMNNIKVASGLPTITAGCSDCPKKDDEGE